MNSKDIFRIGCEKIFDRFKPFDFKSTKNGQVLKKSSNNKLFDFVITFSSSTKNWNGSVSLKPYISVESKSLKKWQKEKYKSENVNGIIFRTSLESLTPLKGKHNDWNIAINNQENIIPQLCETIKIYVFPVFEKFENIDNIINEILNNGLKLNEHFDSRNENLPIDFFIYFGNLKLAELAFNNYLNTQKLKNKAISFYERIQEDKNIPNSNITDLTIKKAYLNGLKIEK